MRERLLSQALFVQIISIQCVALSASLKKRKRARRLFHLWKCDPRHTNLLCELFLACASLRKKEREKKRSAFFTFFTCGSVEGWLHTNLLCKSSASEEERERRKAFFTCGRPAPHKPREWRHKRDVGEI